MPFQLGDKLISDRHLKLAGHLSAWQSRYRKAGLLDVNQPDSPLSQHFRSIREALRNRALDIAELAIFNLAAKYMELNELGKHHPEVVRTVRRRLSSHRLDDYLGVECEIAIASLLLKKGFKFTCPDPPDFQISVSASEKPACIECTSTHVENESDKDLI